MKKRIAFLVISYMLIVLAAPAQELQPLVAQWMYNKLVYNPAYAGSNERVSASVFHRQQWVGFKEGRPVTSAFSLEGPAKQNSIGWGLNLLDDRVGNNARTDVMGNAAYRLNISDETHLSMGLKFGVSYLRRTDVKIWESNDNTFTDGQRTQAYAPRIGAGLYLDNPKYWVGISVPDLYVKDNNNYFANNTSWKAAKDYIAFAGYNLFISDMYTIQPAAMVKLSKDRFYSELNTNILYKDFLKAGVSYRLPYNTVAAMGIFKMSEAIGLGVAYEFTLPSSQIQLPGLGSTLEFMVNYNLW